MRKAKHSGTPRIKIACVYGEVKWDWHPAWKSKRAYIEIPIYIGPPDPASRGANMLW